MKKTIAILLALMMCVSFLAACGGGEPEPESAPADPPAQQEDEPEKEPEKTPAPAPEPAEDGRITISSDEWGDISFVVPDNGDYELLLAEPGQGSLELFDRKLHGQDLYDPYQWMTYQKAFITGDGFDILIGYKDLMEDPNNSKQTFGMTINKWYQPDEVTYDGLDGFGFMKDFYILAFPAITQFGMRLVHIFPHLPDGADEFERNQMEELAKEIVDLPEIHVILDSLKFDGEFISEPRFETEPIEGKLVTVTPTDGWEFSDVDMTFLSAFTLVKEGLGNTFARPYGEIVIITKSTGVPLKEYIEDIKSVSSNEGIEQLDNVTINNQEFLLFHVPKISKFLFLTSPKNGVLDLDMVGHIDIEVNFVDDYNVAMKMLESIIVN